MRFSQTILRLAVALAILAPVAIAQRGGAPATAADAGRRPHPRSRRREARRRHLSAAGPGSVPGAAHHHTIWQGRLGTRRGGATSLADTRSSPSTRADCARRTANGNRTSTKRKDGYDIQQWVGHQPWCNGNIGMFGTSYPAYTQVAPAQFRSPYVKAIVPVSAQSDNFGSVWSSDGLLHLAFSPTWAAQQEAIAEKQPPPVADWVSLAWMLPLKSIPEHTGVRSQFLADVIAHDTHDDFWKAMSIRDKYPEMDVPAFHVTGWYDDLSQETQINFVGMRNHSRTDRAKRWQKLLIGPWGHGIPRFADSGFVLRRRELRARCEDRLPGDAAALVRLSSERRRQRRRQGSARQDLRHGRQQVARRAGLAARSREGRHRTTCTARASRTAASATAC